MAENVCQHCGKEVNSLTETIKDGSIFCNECVELFEYCVQCGNLYLTDLLHDIDDEWVCKKCLDLYYCSCGDCGDSFKSENMYEYNNGLLCNSCYEDSYFTCEECGIIFHNDNFNDGICSGCCDDVIIHSARYKPPAIFYHTKTNTNNIYYGVELEVEVNSYIKNEKAKEIQNILGDFVYLKEDSSLGGDDDEWNNGFEIVSHPATLKKHYELWEEFLNSPPKRIRSWNAKSCGLHIHISRKPLSFLVISRMMIFMNHKDHLLFIEKIAGRNESQYGRFWEKHLKSSVFIYKNCETQNEIEPMCPSHDERYEAINLENYNTVEIRVFKGTLKKASFFKALEFCDALVNFCQPWNKGTPDLILWQQLYKDSLVRMFCEFVKERRKIYPHLYGFISAKIYGVETKESKQYDYDPVQNPILNSKNERLEYGQRHNSVNAVEQSTSDIDENNDDPYL